MQEYERKSFQWWIEFDNGNGKMAVYVDRQIKFRLRTDKKKIVFHYKWTGKCKSLWNLSENNRGLI